MNKRARMRLIGVTAIILIAVAAILLGTGRETGAYYKTVEEVAEDQSLVGERVRVGGTVVPGSWDRRTDPMRFTIRAEEDEAGTGPTINVVYQGGVPSTFGDGVVAIVTGDLGGDGTIESNDMITKCPSKYESAEGALPVSDLVGKGESMVGTTVKITGFVVPGSIVPPGCGQRFLVSESTDGGEELPVAFEGALPSGMADDSNVVITGALEDDGIFVATDVALEQSEQ